VTWVKLDDGFPDNPKVDALSCPAFRLYVSGLCHAARVLTDGFVDSRRVHRLVPNYEASHTAELVDAGLWMTVDGGWMVNDYLKYNPSKAKVEQDRERSAERKKKWLEAREQGRNSVPNGVANGVRNSGPYPTRPAPKGSGSEVTSESTEITLHGSPAEGGEPPVPMSESANRMSQLAETLRAGLEAV
jgi:hypothetical protein